MELLFWWSGSIPTTLWVHGATLQITASALTQHLCFDAYTAMGTAFGFMATIISVRSLHFFDTMALLFAMVDAG